MPDNPIVIKNFGGAEPGAAQVDLVAIAPPPSPTTTLGEGVDPIVGQASPTIWTLLEGLQTQINQITTADNTEYQVVQKFAEDVLSVPGVNVLNDDGTDLPDFFLPPPSSWTNKTCFALRYAQTSDYADVICSDGATINGLPAYTLSGSSGAQFFSDGANAFAIPPMELFLPMTIAMNGQSNAAAAPPGTYGYSAMTHFLSSRLKGWTNTTNAFVNMVDGPANMRADTGGVNPGPGGGQVLTRIAYNVAQITGEDVYTFAAAYTSQAIAYFQKTSLTNAFYSDGTQAGVNNYNLLLQSVQASGRTLELMIFNQGESNAGDTKEAYYALLEALYLDWIADYGSQLKVLLYLTIVDNSGGVRAAQIQLGEAYPDNVIIVDNTDMVGKSAWFFGSHYTDYAGYEKIADRGWLCLQGITTFPVVPDGVGFNQLAAWSHSYQYNQSVVFTGGRQQLVVWQDGVAAASMSAAGGNNSPTHVPFDDTTKRPVARFDRDNSECVRAAITEDGGDWSFALIIKNSISAAGPVSTPVCLYDTGTGERLGLDVPGQSNRWALLEGGAEVSASGPVADQDWHSHLIVCNSTEGVLEWWYDGELAVSVVIAGTQTPTNPTSFFGANIGAVSFFEGDVNAYALVNICVEGSTVAPNLHAYTQIECGI